MAKQLRSRLIDLGRQHVDNAAKFAESSPPTEYVRCDSNQTENSLHVTSESHIQAPCQVSKRGRLRVKPRKESRLDKGALIEAMASLQREMDELMVAERKATIDRQRELNDELRSIVKYILSNNAAKFAFNQNSGKSRRQKAPTTQKSQRRTGTSGRQSLSANEEFLEALSLEQSSVAPIPALKISKKQAYKNSLGAINASQATKRVTAKSTQAAPQFPKRPHLVALIAQESTIAVVREFPAGAASAGGVIQSKSWTSLMAMKMPTSGPTTWNFPCSSTDGQV
jgi:hypothetical protein